MKGRFKDRVWVTLKPDIPEGADPWPRPGQVLTIICDVNEASDLPPLYQCEWMAAGKTHTRLFSERQLESWPPHHVAAV